MSIGGGDVPSPEALRAALRAITDPASGQDIVAAGLIEGIEVRDGLVQVALLTDRAHAAKMEPLRKAAEVLLARHPGVLSAAVVLTAQKPHARVQRSPAIMNVAVPLLQHSQWFGHLALSQTVCNLSSAKSERVWEKVSEVGSLMRSHSGSRGRDFCSMAIIQVRSAECGVRSIRTWRQLVPHSSLRNPHSIDLCFIRG